MAAASQKPASLTGLVPASVVITVESPDEVSVSPAVYIYQVAFDTKPGPWGQAGRTHVATVHFNLPDSQLRTRHPADLPFASAP